MHCIVTWATKSRFEMTREGIKSGGFFSVCDFKCEWKICRHPFRSPFGFRRQRYQELFFLLELRRLPGKWQSLSRCSWLPAINLSNHSAFNAYRSEFHVRTAFIFCPPPKSFLVRALHFRIFWSFVLIFKKNFVSGPIWSTGRKWRGCESARGLN